MRTCAWLYSLSLVLVCLALVPDAQIRADDRSNQSIATAIPIVRIAVENPREINVGKPASFVIVVTNQGKTTATDVVVETIIPEHADLAKTTPEPVQFKDGVATFRVGDLAPGATRRVTLVAVPRLTDPISLQASTRFATFTQSTVLVREPKLKLTALVLPQVEIGSEVNWLIRATNTGDGRADDIVITPRLIEGLVQGSPLQQAVKIGGLNPGESQDVQFTVVPTRRGKLVAGFKASNPDGLEATEESSFQVLQADLSVVAAGPVVQPLAREGTYEIRVANPGDATAGSTLVVVNVPAGLEVTAAAENAYDEATRTLRWRITKVRPSDVVRLPFRAETTAAGDQTLRVVAQCKQTADATATHTTSVISRSNLIVTVVNDQELAALADPVGFKVTVINAGSKRVEDLRVRVAMPDGLKAIDSANYQVADGQITFPVQQLASGEKVTLAFGAIANRVGEHRVRVLVNGGALTRELSFEGSTYCYSKDGVPVSSSPATGAPDSID